MTTVGGVVDEFGAVLRMKRDLGTKGKYLLGSLAQQPSGVLLPRRVGAFGYFVVVSGEVQTLLSYNHSIGL